MSREHFIKKDLTGMYMLMDPVGGDALITDGPPSCVLQDPDLEQGVSFLRDNGPGLLLHTYFSRQRDEHDLGDMTQQAFEKQALAADYYMYEVEAEDRLGSDALINIAARLNREPILRGGRRANVADIGIPEYLERSKKRIREVSPDYQLVPNEGFILRIARMMGIRDRRPSFCYDIRQETRLEARLLRHKKSLETMPTSESKTALQWAYDNLREWCMIGRIGIGIMHHEFGSIDERQGVMTLRGVNGDIIRKLASIGVTAIPRIAPNIAADFSSMHGLQLLTNTGGRASSANLRAMQKHRSAL